MSTRICTAWHSKKHSYPHPHSFTHPNNRRNGSTSAIRAALLDRARTLSRDAAKENITLVAHGSEDDQQNEQ
ncbi:hypothetical protein [Nitrosomonas communis]|uniref:hypothetical protein n=1 Tax=Nitrosomonas communis TaxID=44574 RepID=UPI003D2A49B0